MVSDEEFEILISNSESNILDFKVEHYDFVNDSQFDQTAKFIKDVLSFSNTIRKNSAFIIIGIEERLDGTKIMEGIHNLVDDAVLQDKVKNKLYPLPQFNSYVKFYKEKFFGIIEFQLTKYETPIISHVKMKGIEIGKVYHRRGASNAEAQPMEVIKISDWLRGLPGDGILDSKTSQISKLLKRLTAAQERLSVVISDIYTFSKTHSLEALSEFCSAELRGIQKFDQMPVQEEWKYRMRSELISPHKVEIRPGGFVKVTSTMVKHEMEKNQTGFKFNPFLYNQSLPELERFLSKPDGVARFELSASQIFEDSEKDDVIYAYIFPESWEAIYANVRQKAIENLMDV